MSEEKKAKVKIAPNSKESEMMVLGCMLTKVNSLNVAADALQAKDFYYGEHQIIFDVLKALFKSDKPADIHLVAEELKRLEKLDDVGGVGYLTTLAQYAGTSAYIEEYVELIKNKAILRRMIYASQEIEKVALEEPGDVHGALDDAQAAFFAISQTTNTSVGTQIKEILSGAKAESGLPYLKELEDRQETYLEKGEDALAFTGVPTGFADLDKMINGLAPSNFIILAGRPGMGKTALALNIAEHVSFKHQMPVGIFSLEMSAEQLLHRMICSQSEVESAKIQTGSLNGSEYQRVVGAVNKMQEIKMIIDDQPGLKITDLRARARRMKEAHDIQLLVIDYLQLLSGSSHFSGRDNRQGEISEISRMLKTLARELNIPILCGSQLSRKVEERTGHRPMMSDLRESGAIEQDADIVMFLLRREYYDPYDKPGLAEVIVGKNRHGKVGSIDVAYRKEFAQFANYTPTDEGSLEDNSEAFEAFSP
ncbi:replicative DNA helicase [Candidatus Neptunochlamydia vexilliferae]|uniref:Replicative DNA helicase n=1 Tax=Candidatus Neptunichlamydia vexilliferae TaxID=1651774 RepID=A0ABS0B125_9BACT|nr:replicative DNA helicase [Candidatus Neptunochlamydia vexilliferae]MBF5060095.1 Replicative DNA helicase [Candidatus Neptunochlamydia vexilliferae]